MEKYIPVVVIKELSETDEILTALKNNGINCAEITFRTVCANEAKDYTALEIMDRVGGGDSFASGLVYGLMTTNDPETAVNYDTAHGALAMTTPGDTTMANLKEVEAIMGGKGARVQR